MSDKSDVDEERVDAIVEHVQTRLEAMADPEKATEMAAYMKTEMFFHGVQSPQRQEILGELKKLHKITDSATHVAAIEALWAGDSREEKYLAIRLARAYPKLITFETYLDLFERMIREGSWWDFTDEIASHLVGKILADHPEQTWPIMDQWLEDECMWIRRTALLAQLRFKENTDVAWLLEACEALMDEKEFFIRKAIGWALRELSRTEPETVREWTDANKPNLSGLSYREARKRLGK